MLHDPNHPIWKEIDEEASQVRGKLEKGLEDYENGAIHMYRFNTPGDVKYTHEHQFNREESEHRYRAKQLEDRFGTQASGYSPGFDGAQSPEWFRNHNEEELEGTDKGHSRNVGIAERAEKVQGLVDRRAGDYETHVFHEGTYPGQMDHFAVTYHKPTGEMAASMKFGSTGHVMSWAEHPEHKGGAAALATGLAAHKYLKSLGSISGALHSETTTPESSRVLRTMDPYSTSLQNRNPLSSYGEEGTLDMLTKGPERMNIPTSLSILREKHTSEDYARLSDMTGRHPMNFLALSSDPRDRARASNEGFDTREDSRLDPTILQLAKQREDTNYSSDEEKDRPEAIRRFEHGFRASTRTNNIAERFGDPEGTHLNVYNEMIVHADDSRHRHEVAKATARREARETLVSRYPNLVQDAGMYVHEEPYTPRTTEERLAQDPLARARIIRGKAFYSDRKVGHDE